MILGLCEVYLLINVNSVAAKTDNALGMKSTLTIFCLLLLGMGVRAQNLVLNPSFENTSSNCANFGGEGFTTDLIDWDDTNSGADSCSSPDLFSACNLFATVMPGSILGYQQSRTGTRHAGIITYAPGIAAGCNALGNDQYREYIQGRTSQPLQAGQSYCVAMYVSLANDVAWATNNIGVYFSPTNYQHNACPSNSLISNVTPQLNYACAALTDTVNWVRLQWNYTATGGEQYFVIGNFFNNAGTTVGCNNSGAGTLNPYAYYYIDDVSITANACCYADILPVAAQCLNGAPVTLSAIPGLESGCTPQPLAGTWSGPGITDAAAGTFSPAVAGVGTHTVTFTLACGYVATTQVIVGPCTPLVVCQNGNSLTVSNGVGPYLWQQQVTQQDCSGCFPGVPPFVPPCSLPPGCAVSVTAWQTYSTGATVPAPTSFPVQVVDAAGTVYTLNNLSGLPPCANCPPITVTAGTVGNVSCAGGNDGSASVSASGGVGTYDYLWMPGNLTGASQTGLAAGIYTVTATDDNGCAGTQTIVVNQPTALTLQTSVTPAGCGLNDGSATVTASGGTTPYGYAWSPTGGSAATAGGLGAGNYTVTVTDFKGCQQTASVTVSNVGGPAIAVVGQEFVSCAGGADGSIEISITQGTPPYTIAWSPAGGSGITAQNLSAGSYTVTVTDADGCVGTQSATVTEPPALVLGAAASPATCGFADGSAAVAVSGGTPPYTYQWSPTGGTADLAMGLAAGAYTVAVTDFSNCTQTASVEVEIAVADSSLQAVLEVSPETCVGNDGTAQVTVTGGLAPYTYSWSMMPDSEGPSVAGLAAGSYSVTVSDQCYSITQPVEIEQAFVIPKKELPNIITPNRDAVNDVLYVGNQFEASTDFYCVIYNRWGVPIYKTESKSISWAPKHITDGTYYIVVSYTDCSGNKEKISATVTVADSIN